MVGVDRDDWDPEQYHKFATERAQPFLDLLGLVVPVPGAAVIDLGCGTGELTARLHDHLGAGVTIGMDASAAMLEKARSHGFQSPDGRELRFEIGDITSFAARSSFDVVFSNAALHWVPDHAVLLTRLAEGLRPGGQLAVQVPANADHPSHALASEVAAEAPFREHLAATLRPGAEQVLAPQEYAELLDELGFAQQHVRLQVYGHHLASTAAVVEWTKGTTLLRFQSLLPDELFDAFVDRYRQRVLEVLGARAPYFYSFKRILFWARLPTVG